MPAALQVDWNEVKMLALSIGVREAARQFGLSEDAVRQRSSREGWLTKQREHEAKVQTIQAKLRTDQGLSPQPVTAADLLAKMGSNTRAKLASVAQRAAEKLDTLEPEELLSPTVTSAANQYTSMASKLHGWEAKQSAQSNGVVINIALAGLTPDMALECSTLPQDASEDVSAMMVLPDTVAEREPDMG